MFLRVRGKGASRENSQAVVMSLRGFNTDIGRGGGAITNGGSADDQKPLIIPLAPFRVAMFAQGCSDAARWKEIWNLYDIAYDEFDSKVASRLNSLTTASPAAASVVPLACVYSVETDDTGKSSFRSVAVTPGSESTAPRILVSLIPGFGSSYQQTAWLLSFLVDSLPFQHLGRTAEGDRFRIPTVQLEIPLELITGAAGREMFQHWASAFWRLLLSERYQVEKSSLNGVEISLRLSPATENGATDSESVPFDLTVKPQRFGANRVTGTNEPKVLWVPLYSDDDDSDDDAEAKREDQVLNFCPCCGVLDPAQPGFHSH
jgi:hypothetical protein